jgi:hypothetical protein
MNIWILVILVLAIAAYFGVNHWLKKKEEEKKKQRGA